MAKIGGVPENLKSWVPGQSGNPKGKPKGSKNISTYLRMLNEAESSADVPEGKLRDLVEMIRGKGYDNGAATLAHQLFSIALNKDMKPEVKIKAIETIMDRLEGKATQKTELTGKDGGALALTDASEYEASLKDMTVEELEEHKRLLEQADKLVKQSQQRKARAIDEPPIEK